MPKNKPKLGQNFLTDPSARLKIVEALGDISTSTVLEIGPGRGALTDLLAARAGRLIAVELDRTLGPRLAEIWRHAAHVRILQADILDLSLADLGVLEKLVVVGNLPYYITSDILLHLFSQTASIWRAVVMVQDEVADRLAAPCGISEYGLLSATAQMHARVEKLFVLPPEAFSPAPKIQSAVVRLEMRPRFVELEVERVPFMRFLQVCFRQKRKTLSNNLKSAAPGEQERILASIQAAGLRPSIRAEAVPLDAMARLFQEIHRVESTGEPAAPWPDPTD